RKINTNISINNINDTTIGQEIEISGVLTDEFGNTLPNTSIVIIINGQEYTTTTDNNGKYNYIYTTSTLGENIVSVNYPGDNKYSPSSNQTSFDVRRINTNLSIDT
ncbi:Ig-like domain-containing protein, partial [Methanosphaera stadtmanae]|uniref:Ig-like domain-containing protein n=1 Tax=Methanosphaera stadtmanae TaxID=2317 RepID=UPI0011BD1D4F